VVCISAGVFLFCKVSPFFSSIYGFFPCLWLFRCRNRVDLGVCSYDVWMNCEYFWQHKGVLCWNSGIFLKNWLMEEKDSFLLSSKNKRNNWNDRSNWKIE
jgi:hypothetical protein